MSISAFSGPQVVFGPQTGVTPETNPDVGTSLFYAGSGLLDPRPQLGYKVGQNFGAQTCGWLGTNAIQTVYGPPMTLVTTKLSSTGVHIVAATPMTLISATTTGVAVGVSAIRQDTGATVTGLMLDPLSMSCTAALTINSNVLTVSATGATNGNNPIGITLGMVLTDATTAANIPTGTTIVGFGTGNGGLGTYIMSANAVATAASDTVTGLYTALPCTVPLGQSGTIQMYHPGGMISRCVSITSTTSQVDVTTFVVNGLDVYGFPMTENIVTSGTSATTTSGKKAFKLIISVTPDKTDGTGNYSVGTLDIFGFPIRSDQYQVGMVADTALMMNNALITSSTGYLAAVKTVATATTGDVRGTYAVQTASSGVLKLGVTQSPFPQNLQTAVGLYGVAQYAGF